MSLPIPLPDPDELIRRIGELSRELRYLTAIRKAYQAKADAEARAARLTESRARHTESTSDGGDADATS